MASVDPHVVFINGSAGGIGAEVARRLHANGAKPVLTDVDDASKAGVEHLANALRVEVAYQGVGVGSARMSWIDPPWSATARTTCP